MNQSNPTNDLQNDVLLNQTTGPDRQKEDDQATGQEQLRVTDISPDFEFDKYQIDVEDIKDEVEKLLEAHLTGRFPLDVFPSPFHELIQGCFVALNFPKEYTAASILVAVATAIGKSAKLKVKAGWYEFCSLYMVLVGNPGTNKSHPLAMALGPFEEMDRIAIQNYALAVAEWDVKNKEDKKDKIDIGQGPKLKKTILNNFTPEILLQRLTDNERGSTIQADELATFFEGMNNYSKGDQVSTYLSIWSNKGTSVDRVKSLIPLFLPHPYLNIVGTLQPRMLPKLFPPQKTDNGFIQRFLFAYPENMDKQPINDNELDEDLLVVYSNWINNYMALNPITFDIESNKPKAKTYHWSNEAKLFFYKWQKENTDDVVQNGDTLLGESINKFDIHFVRLSLILQIMIDFNTTTISLRATEGAAKLCEYFKGTSAKVLDMLISNNNGDSLPNNKHFFYSLLPEKFTTAEANTVGRELGLHVKFVQRFINNKLLFDHLSHGHYSKKANNPMS